MSPDREGGVAFDEGEHEQHEWHERRVLPHLLRRHARRQDDWTHALSHHLARTQHDGHRNGAQHPRLRYSLRVTIYARCVGMLDSLIEPFIEALIEAFIEAFIEALFLISRLLCDFEVLSISRFTLLLCVDLLGERKGR